MTRALLSFLQKGYDWTTIKCRMSLIRIDVFKEHVKIRI